MSLRAHEIVSGSRIRIPEAASSLFVIAYDLRVTRVEPSHDPQILSLQGIAYRLDGDVPLTYSPGVGPRTTRVRFEHCKILEPAAGALCSDPACLEIGWHAAPTTMMGGGFPSLRCDDHAKEGDVPLTDVEHKVFPFARRPGLIMSCPCGWQIAVPPASPPTDGELVVDPQAAVAAGSAAEIHQQQAGAVRA